MVGNPQSSWDPYVGIGIPDVFEAGLGWDGAHEGEEFLRIGVGRMHWRW